MIYDCLGIVIRLGARNKARDMDKVAIGPVACWPVACLLTVGAHAHSEGYCSCRVCMCVCVCMYVCVCDHS